MDEREVMNVFNKPYKPNDTLLIVLDGDIHTNILFEIKSINIEKNELELTSEYQELKLKIDEEHNIILKTDDYYIIDIENVSEIQNDELDDIMILQLTEEVFPEIIDIIELDESEYNITINDMIESFIFSIINKFSNYDNDMLITKMYSISENFIELLDILKKPINYEDRLTNSWIHIISNSHNKIYIQKEQTNTDELYEIEDGYFTTVFEKEYMHILKEIYLDNKHICNRYYKNLLNILYNENYSPVRSFQKNNGFTIPYNGEYYRDCFNKCTSNTTKIDIDKRRTRNNLQLSTSDGILEYISPELIHINGILIPSDELLRNDIKIFKYFNITEKCIFTKMKYNDSLHQHMNNVIQSKDLYTQTTSEDLYFNYKDSTLINIENDMNIDEFINAYIPSQTHILKNTTLKPFFKYVYNFNDLNRLLYYYQINSDNLLPNNKHIIGKLIKKNIKKYKSSLKGTIPIKKINESKTKLDKSDRVNIILNFASKLLNERIKSVYYKKVINKYSREPTKHENIHWFYNKYTNNRLLCKHHIYSCEIDDNPEIMDTLIHKYGSIPLDGFIYCKHCGKILSNDIFSDIEGGGDTGSNIIREIADEESKETILDKKEIQHVKKLINQITNVFGIGLIDKDLIDIIELYLSINNETLLNERYNIVNASTEHPSMKASTSIMEQKKIGHIFINVNTVLFIMICTLIYIQTNIPGYISKHKLYLPILSTSKSYNKEVIPIIFEILEDLSNRYNTTIWNSIGIFLKEYGINSIPTPKEQFINLLTYIINSSYLKLNDKINRFFEKSSEYTVYIKNYFNQYKPIPSNDTIESINSDVNNAYINSKGKYNNYIYNKSSLTLENISNVKLIKKLHHVDELYKDYNVPILDLLNNKNFILLYKYIIQLHGIQNSNTYFYSIITELINVHEKIRGLFTKYKWNTKENKFINDNIDFKELKKLLGELINSYVNKINNKTVKLFAHSIFCNNELLMLTTESIRYQKYIELQLFPEDIASMNKDLIERFINMYCYNNNNIIIRDLNYINTRNSITHSYIDIFLDGSQIYDPCKNRVPNTIENFNKLINEIHTTNKLPLYKLNKTYTYSTSEVHGISNYDEVSNRIINRLTDYIEGTDIIEFDELFVDLANEEQWEITFSELNNKIKEYISNIISFISNSEHISKKNMDNINIDNRSISKNQIMVNLHKKLLILCFGSNEANKEIKGTSKESIDELLPLDSHTIYNIINEITTIISRLKNNGNRIKHGCIFHDYIPKQWKLSDTNIDSLKQFINTNEFLLHNSIFIRTKEESMGFNQYYEYDYQSEYFNNLYNHINSKTKQINKLTGDNKSKFTRNYSNILSRYILIQYIHSMVNYVHSLEEKIDNSDDDANELFLQLQAKYNVSINDELINISNFIIDIIVHIISEFFDSRWIISLEYKNNLQEKIGQQKEKEKQRLITKLDLMDRDKRGVSTQLQSMGFNNYYKSSEIENQQLIDSELFATSIEKERIDLLIAQGIGEEIVSEDVQMDDLTGKDISDEGYDQGEDASRDDLFQDEGVDSM